MTFPGETNSWPGSKTSQPFAQATKPAQHSQWEAGLGPGAWENDGQSSLGKTHRRSCSPAGRKATLSARGSLLTWTSVIQSQLLPHKPMGRIATPRNGPHKPLAQHHPREVILSQAWVRRYWLFIWPELKLQNSSTPERILPWNTAEPQKQAHFFHQPSACQGDYKKNHTEQRVRHLVCT